MNPVLSTPNTLAIIFTFFTAVFVPIILLIIIRIKTKAQISSFFIGALTYFVFVVVFEQMLHSVVLTGLGNISQFITNNIWLYALYIGLAAGIFEETGRFMSIKFYMKNNLNPENALMYGIGHGGIESIILVALTKGAPAYPFYIVGIERLLAMTLHIALSIIIYKAVTQRGKMGYYPLAMGIHFISNFLMVIVAHYFGIIMAEIACLVCVTITVIIATRIWNEKKTEKVEVNF